MRRFRILSVVLLAVLFATLLPADDETGNKKSQQEKPIPEDATTSQLQEIVSNSQESETRRLTALKRLAHHGTDAEELGAVLPFYLKLEKSVDSEALATEALSGILRCIKARDGLGGVLVYLRKRIESSQSEVEKARLKPALSSLTETLSLLKLHVRETPGYTGHETVTLEAQPARSQFWRREAIELLVPDRAEREQIIRKAEQEAAKLYFIDYDALLTEKKYQEARKGYLHVVTSYPGTPQALQAFERVLDSFAEETGQFDRGVASYLSWMEGLPGKEDTAYGLYVLARKYYRLGRFEDAESILVKLKKNGESVWEDEHEILLALCQARQGKNEEAISSLQSVAERNEGKDLGARALFLVGWLHIFEGEPEEGRTYLVQVIDKYPGTDFARQAEQLVSRIEGGRE